MKKYSLITEVEQKGKRTELSEMLDAVFLSNTNYDRIVQKINEPDDISFKLHFHKIMDSQAVDALCKIKNFFNPFMVHEYFQLKDGFNTTEINFHISGKNNIKKMKEELLILKNSSKFGI